MLSMNDMWQCCGTTKVSREKVNNATKGLMFLSKWVHLWKILCEVMPIHISPILREIHTLICTMWGWQFNTTVTWDYQGLITKRCHWWTDDSKQMDKFGKHCVRSSAVIFYDILIHAYTNILKMGRLCFCYHLNNLTVHQGYCFNMQYLF